MKRVMDRETNNKLRAMSMHTQSDLACMCSMLQGQEANQIALAHHQTVPEAGRQIVPEIHQTAPEAVPQTGPGGLPQTGLHKA